MKNLLIILFTFCALTAMAQKKEADQGHIYSAPYSKYDSIVVNLNTGSEKKLIEIERQIKILQDAHDLIIQTLADDQGVEVPFDRVVDRRFKPGKIVYYLKK